MAALLLADACSSLGENERALELLRTIRDTYPNPLVVEARIQSLQGARRTRTPEPGAP